MFIAPELKENDVNVVAISNDGQLLGVGDNVGKARIFLYPTHLRGQASIQLDGHVNHVTAMNFMQDDSLLVTGGEYDCCLMFWSYKYNKSGDGISQNIFPLEESKEAINIEINDKMRESMNQIVQNELEEAYLNKKDAKYGGTEATQHSQLSIDI